jgi:membrane-bound ClpP family serine protease
VIIAFATIISTVLSVLLYFFILLPLKSAEVSMAYTDESLAGQIGKVIVPIPVDGFGEVVIETVNGLISKRAVGFDNEEIEYNQQVLIVEVKEGTVYVRAYEPMFSK